MKKIQNVLGATLTVAVLGSVMAGCADSTAVTTNTTPAPTPTPSTANTTPATNSNSQVVTSGVNASYKDGKYSAKGEYMTPAGIEQVDVSVTLKSGKIEDTTFAGAPVAPASKMMQGKFSEGFKEVVVGKSINDVSLTVVNGSSLTPKGFMDALIKIKAQALNA